MITDVKDHSDKEEFENDDFKESCCHLRSHRRQLDRHVCHNSKPDKLLHRHVRRHKKLFTPGRTKKGMSISVKERSAYSGGCLNYTMHNDKRMRQSDTKSVTQTNISHWTTNQEIPLNNNIRLPSIINCTEQLPDASGENGNCIFKYYCLGKSDRQILHESTLKLSSSVFRRTDNCTKNKPCAATQFRRLHNINNVNTSYTNDHAQRLVADIKMPPHVFDADTPSHTLHDRTLFGTCHYNVPRNRSHKSKQCTNPWSMLPLLNRKSTSTDRSHCLPRETTFEVTTPAYDVRYRFNTSRQRNNADAPSKIVHNKSVAKVSEWLTKYCIIPRF